MKRKLVEAQRQMTNPVNHHHGSSLENDSKRDTEDIIDMEGDGGNTTGRATDNVVTSLHDFS